MTSDDIRHRLMEGVLLRLARLPDAGGLALRGGMLLRRWFPRSALDLDLVAPSPLPVEAGRRFLPLFADEAVEDGVAFDPRRLRLEGIWQHTENCGVRLRAAGAVGDEEGEIQVDITGGPSPVPAAVMDDLPTACGLPARVWQCRPEAVVGQKLQALWHHGLHRWRPKDLADLRRLLVRVPLDAASVREAVAALFADLGATVEDARSLFDAPWWRMKSAAGRWRDWGAPGELPEVVAGVAERLVPMLEG